MKKRTRFHFVTALYRVLRQLNLCSKHIIVENRQTGDLLLLPVEEIYAYNTDRVRVYQLE